MRACTVLSACALFGCGLDDRPVEVNGACLRAPASRVVADFSDALVRGCPAGYCARDFVASSSVELEGTPGGLVFPYASYELSPMLLDLVSAEEGASEPNLRLWAGTLSEPVPVDAALGFALRLADCVDASDFRTLSFTTDITNGGLGNCELRVAAQFVRGDVIEYAEVKPLGESPELAPVPVEAGASLVPLDRNPGSSALAGLQWEFTVPGGDPAGCSAGFTIDDLVLVP